jgi:hypothetical protein
MLCWPGKVWENLLCPILLWDPTVPFLGLYAKECSKTIMFLAAVLIIFKLWNQQRDVKIKCTIYRPQIYWNYVISSNMDGSRDHISQLAIISRCELSIHINERTVIPLFRKKESTLFFSWEIILHIKTWGVEEILVKGLKMSLASQVPEPHPCKSYLLRRQILENHCLKPAQVNSYRPCLKNTQHKG